MNENNGATKHDADSAQAVVQPWVDYWMELYEKNADWTKSLMAGAPPNVDPNAIRKQWMGAMTKSIEAFMRTPAFLESMKKNAEALTATKITSELAKREIARESGVPHIEDISGLYDRLETAHETVLARLQSIESRLESIEKKLAAKPKKGADNKQ